MNVINLLGQHFEELSSHFQIYHTVLQVLWLAHALLNVIKYSQNKIN